MCYATACFCYLPNLDHVLANTFTVSCFQSYLRNRPLGLSVRPFPEKFSRGVKTLPIK